MNVTIQFMNEGSRPSPSSVKFEARRTLSAVEAVRQDYLGRGYELHRPDPSAVMGAHANLWIAIDIAQATAPYYGLTQSRLELAEVSWGALSGRNDSHISISAVTKEEGEVTVYTGQKGIRRPLTGRLIERVLAQRDRLPDLTLLVMRFGKKPPAEMFDDATRDVSRPLGRTLSSSIGFHIFGK